MSVRNTRINFNSVVWDFGGRTGISKTLEVSVTTLWGVGGGGGRVSKRERTASARKAADEEKMTDSQTDRQRDKGKME